MSTKKFILSLDQGTTSSRAILFDEGGEIVKISQKEFTQIMPNTSWVEHDPIEIIESIKEVINEVSQNITTQDIITCGIANQRETTVVWNKHTGKPIYNAIVWQDARTSEYCKELKARDLEEYVNETTGLVIDSYFSATKINWILNNVEGAKEDAAKGNLLFGTIDTWIIWNLSDERMHVTEYSNASRTMLFNIEKLKWDKKLCDEMEVPLNMLPVVQDSASNFGTLTIEGTKIPISGVAGDQQAALFGQCCFKAGEAKNTYGTGCFMLMNTESDNIKSNHGLLTTIAWGLDGKITYALEGSVFIAGAAIQWLRDGLNVIENASETEFHANKIIGNNEVYVVPAFAGLGAPYWDMDARGGIFGLTRDSGKDHIIKASLESLAYQTKDVLDAMQRDANINLASLNVDGGACANNYLMQFQADILSKVVDRPTITESTARGVAFLAGISIGLWTMDELKNKRKSDNIFHPKMDKDLAIDLYDGWTKAVHRCMQWK